MNRIITTTVVALASVAAMAQQDTQYSIKGTCPADAQKVYILDMTQRSNPVVDSAAVSAGQFAIKGTAKKDALLRLVASKRGGHQTLFFNDGTPITADLGKRTISGSELNNKLNAYDNELDAMQDEMNPLIEQYNKARQSGATQDELQKMAKDIQAKMEPINERITKRTLEIINANRDNLIPAAFLGNVVYDLEFAELKDLFDAKNAYAGHPALAAAKRYVDAQAKKAAFVGQKFADIEENDVDGKPHKLSEYLGKGNYVLIDFWASWCGPCRAEMPNVKAAYEKYKGKGFNIVGLSFDSKLENWKKAIQDMQIPWIHLSDLKGWQTLAGKTYGIQSIPASFLVDPNGTIVAADLRGDKLGDKLKEIYGE